jgi:MYXO-CTERM domain-containing protein
MPRSKTRSLLVVVALIAAGACSSKGCSCVTPIKGGFPTGDRHESAIQLRAAAPLFSYLEQNAKTVLNGLLPGMGLLNVPASCSGSNKICCGTPQPTCQIKITPQALVAQPTPPNVLHVVFTTQLVSQQQIPVEFNTGLIGTAKCLVTIDTTKGTAGHTDIDLLTDVQFPVNATTDTTGLNAMNTTINNLDASMLDLQSQPGDFLCTIANFGPIKSFVIGQIQTQLTTQITDTINQQTCMKCMDKTDCNSFASDCKMGLCVEADGKTCIQEVGLDGRMDVGKSLASFSPSTQAGIDVLAVLGGYAVADTGLSLGMLGGGLPDPHSNCVPMTAKPAAVTVAQSKTFTLDTLPDGATPFHLGIGVHRSYLDQVGWAAFDAGAICLDVGTPQVALLTAKTISVVIPSLSDLTHGDAPMFLVMRPHAPPTFSLGKGTFKTDMNGMKQIDDALLHVHVPKFTIDFYAWVDERYVRIMSLNADLEIPVALSVDAMGKIVPQLGDFTKAFTNVTVTNTELLAESPGDLAKTFPTLLGLAGGQLTSVLKPIALPAIMGLNITPIAMTSTDPDSDGAAQFLSIFANLSSATAESLNVRVDARLVDVELPPREAFAVDARDGSEPVLHVAVAGRGAAGPPEYSWQLDGAGWSPFSEIDRLTITHPLLWLPGHHTLELRGRMVGQPDTVSAEPTQLDVLVDPNGFHGRTTNPPPSGGCGCDVGGAPSPSSGAAIVVALLGAVLLLRRRAKLFALLLLVGAAGCNNGLGQGDFEAPVDEVGRYSDLVALNGVLHISAYDDSTGDLAYARVTDTTQPIAWQYVDGIDPNASADTPGGYRHGVSDPGPDVGYYSSIALTQSGDPRIAYWDLTDNAVKLALGPHPWKTVTVDSTTTTGQFVGLYTAISLDGGNVPSIAYLATGISNGDGTFHSELRVATANSASPGDGEFTVTVVDKQRVSCAGLCAGGKACIQAAMVNGMPNGDPSQSTCTKVDTTCTTMCSTTQACIAGTCTTFLPAPKAEDLIEGIGLFTRALRVNGQLVLVYYDREQGDLKIATQAGSSWQVGLIDGNDPSTDVGQHCTAALDASNTIHVAYQDAINDRLLYKQITGTTATMTPEVIDDGMRMDGPHPVGAGAAITVAGGNPRVVYQDQQLSDLESASRSGTAWSHMPLDSGIPGFGFFPRLAVDGAKVWLSQFVYDRENANPPLGTLQISTLP